GPGQRTGRGERQRGPVRYGHRCGRRLRALGHAAAATAGPGDAGGAGQPAVRGRVHGPEGEGRHPFRGENRPTGGDRLARRYRRDRGGGRADPRRRPGRRPGPGGGGAADGGGRDDGGGTGRERAVRAEPGGGRVTTPTGAPPSGLAPGGDGQVWHTLSVELALQAEGVDEQRGLSSAEVAARAQRFGPN